MSHRSVTPEDQSSMPKPSGLFQRGSRYYANVKVPRDLVDALGKDKFFESLKTSDYREACERLRYRLSRYQAEIDEARRKLASIAKDQPSERQRLITLPDNEAFELAVRYLVTIEERQRTRFEAERSQLSPSEFKERRETLELDLGYYRGEMENCTAPDGSDETERFLKELGFECAPSSPAFQKLKALILSAQIEHLERLGDVLAGETVQERDNRFRGVHAYSPISQTLTGPTVDDLIANHRKRHELKNRKPKTKMAVRPAYRLLREILGGAKLLSSITFEHMDRLFEVMRQIPVNASTKYPGLTYLQAIEAAKTRGDTRKPSANTNWATFSHIHAAFKFAVEDELLTKNWAAHPRYQDMFPKVTPKQKDQFTPSELNRLFRAPLYIGCVDDGRSYAKSGPHQIRRGRFWIPLLALFHGMRTNEACQLYAEDVKLNDGIHYIAIRETLDDHEATEKKVKTKKSIRNVPIHPELERLGFLEFVRERRKEGASSRLFPEIKLGNTGYYSDAFSKWFVRFVQFSLGNCKATLHSFRHQFRDAARFAGLSEESVGNIAGWDDGSHDGRNHIRHYGKGAQYFPFLATQLARVEYPGLDLSHLYPENCKGIIYAINLRE